MKNRPLLLLWTCCLVLAAGTAGASVSADTSEPGSSPATTQQAAAWRDMAQAFEHGRGVARDPQQAMALYCKAAMAGDADARYRLGWIYANGRGTPRSDAFAAYFFELATQQGHPQSANMLRLMGQPPEKPPCVLAAEREATQREAEALAEAEKARREARYRELANNEQRRRILAIVDRLAPQYGIHPGLAFAVIRAESNFDPQAISLKNAQGLMQLIPETAERFQVRKPFDPEQNIRGGLAYLRWLLAYYQGEVALALAAYNAGEGTVDRYKGVPPFAETQGYLRRIQEVFDLAQHPFDARVTGPSQVVVQAAASAQ